MNRRPVRMLLFLIVLLAAVATGSYLVRTQASARAAFIGERAFTNNAGALATRLADLRAAQQAYVAAGQGEMFWATRAGASLETVKQELDQLKRAALFPASGEALDAAISLTGDFERMDARAREYVRRRQQLMAADLIFTEGLEITNTIASHVETARLHEQQGRDDELAETTRLQAVALGSAAALTLLVALVLAATHESDVILQSRTRFSQASRPPLRADSAVDKIDKTGTGEKVETIERSAAPAAESRTSEALPAPSASTDGASAHLLRTAAELCTDLGRVASATELPGLLERAARMLDASGVIVWMADAPGARLRPVLAHGYGAAALSRIKPIHPESDNATASAYRLARLETVRTNGIANGAIVAPIMSSMGCVGVMAAEVRNGAECRTALQAMASIFAAQLAALVTATPTVSDEETPQELSKTS